VLPLAGRDDAREGVERKDAFRALFDAVDREGDALLEEEQLEAAELLAEFLVAEAGKLLGDVTVIGPDLPRGIDELVEEVGPLVVGQDHAYK
jgi:hypothetical protein